ncbi:MAG: hypothetical protein R3C68_11695, partial [Myxococcota bacterium]
VFSAGETMRLRLEDLPIAQISIVVLLVEVLLLASLLLLPTGLALRRRLGQGGQQGLIAVVFSGYGFAFMLVEIVLIQILTRIVGEPVWSIVGVLAVLLVSSGIGSALFAGRLLWSPQRGTLLAAMAAMSVAICLPAAVDALEHFPLGARVFAAALMVLPVGLFLGIPFSSTLQHIKEPQDTAWAWAVNSVSSVGGSIAALILCSSIGLRLSAMIAASVYLLIYPALAGLVKPGAVLGSTGSGEHEQRL